jgi:hypothetical protein
LRRASRDPVFSLDRANLSMIQVDEGVCQPAGDRFWGHFPEGSASIQATACMSKPGLGHRMTKAQLLDASEQVSEAVASDSETQAYVEALEQRSDVLEQNIPSGDSLADSPQDQRTGASAEAEQHFK